MPEVAASFNVDVDALHEMGVVDPSSAKSLEIYRSGKLNANQRLYFSLWGTHLLRSNIIEKHKKIIRKGSAIDAAYFVVKGSLLGVDGERIFRLGEGSVIGLAEGLIGHAMPYDVISVTSVQVRIIPLHKIIPILMQLPQPIQVIFKTIIKRTLEKA
jgi:CRP-like cAMP-binding protein